VFWDCVGLGEGAGFEVGFGTEWVGFGEGDWLVEGDAIGVEMGRGGIWVLGNEMG